MGAADAVLVAREAFRRQAWADAYAHYVRAEADLEAEDVERLAMIAYLLGKDRESHEQWTRAHQQFLARGDTARAARCAFWLAFGLLNHGDRIRAGAWVTRGERVLDDSQGDCVERGYLSVLLAFQHLARGDMKAAYDTFCAAAECGERYRDADLAALARHSRGRLLIRMGAIREGVALLDEAMVAVDAGDVSPVVVGDVYCSVIEGCHEVFDVRRAQEWTATLTRWCASQPDLKPYRGQCLVRRAEILQLHGIWADAVLEADHACQQFLEGPDQPAAGAAFYQRGELHRLRGEFDAAERAYRRANRYGHSAQPGLALLRLAQGQVEVAHVAIQSALDQTSNLSTRSRLLPAGVEIFLEAANIDAARAACDELRQAADTFDAPLLHAAAAQAGGTVLLAAADARGALPVLRQAWTTWQELEVPYEAARVRLRIGQAWSALGDRDAAEMEFDAARSVFQQLGAKADLERAAALSRENAGPGAGELSTRELQVLRLVASGKSNRQIAAELFISERTVERHVSNILTKLDVSSRAAATAYAYQHRLV